LSETQSGPLSPGPVYRAPPPKRRPLWRTLLWVALAIVVAGLVAFLLTPHGQPGGGAGAGRGGGRGGRGAAAAAGAGAGSRRPPTVVGEATATLGDIPIQINALGTVTPQASVIVRSQISGVLQAVYFQEGQNVRQGQLLALVDPRPYEIALQQAQGQLIRDQAALDEARLTLSRDRTLLAEDSIARQTVDDQAATVRQNEGVVKSDEAQVASARLNINYCHIKAPVSGRVGLRQVDPGNFVSTGDTNGVVVVNEVDPATVIFTIPEDSIPQVAARIAAGGGLPATAYDRTGTTVLAQGLLYTLDNQIDTTTGTVKARARFANPNGTLFANQFVNVTVLVDTMKSVVTIPAVAVRHGPQGDFVYVIQDDSTVKVTPVKVGPAIGETTSIASGLSAGDKVVTDGGDRLSDGGKVVQPQDAQRMAQAMNRKKPAGGIWGWIQGLFGIKQQPSGNAGQYGASSQANASQSGQGAARRAALMASLNLTADQQAKAKAIFDDARVKAEDAGDDFQARRAVMQAANAQFEAILTPEQKAKYEAARSQRSGQPPAAASQSAAASAAQSATPPANVAVSSAPRAHNRGQSGQPPAAPSGQPPVARGGPPGGPGGRGPGRFMDALGLSPAQKAQADQIFAQARAQAQGSSDPDARRAAMRAAMGKLDAILTPAQKAKLAQMRAQMQARGAPGGNQ
jgi:membrane fusion protein, multidrug efflux system